MNPEELTQKYLEEFALLTIRYTALGMNKHIAVPSTIATIVANLYMETNDQELANKVIYASCEAAFNMYKQYKNPKV